MDYVNFWMIIAEIAKAIIRNANRGILWQDFTWSQNNVFGDNSDKPW